MNINNDGENSERGVGRLVGLGSGGWWVGFGWVVSWVRASSSSTSGCKFQFDFQNFQISSCKFQNSRFPVANSSCILARGVGVGG